VALSRPLRLITGRPASPFPGNPARMKIAPRREGEALIEDRMEDEADTTSSLRGNESATLRQGGHVPRAVKHPDDQDFARIGQIIDGIGTVEHRPQPWRQPFPRGPGQGDACMSAKRAARSVTKRVATSSEASSAR